MTDTRDDFEAHFKPTIRQQKRHMNGDYRDPLTQAKWLGWHAREPRIAELEAHIAAIEAQNRRFVDDLQAFFLRDE